MVGGFEKNSMDVIDVYVASSRYTERLRNCFLDNFYKASFYWLMRVRCKERVLSVKVEPGVRFHVSSVEPGEKRVDPFTIFVRRRLGNARIKDVRQLGWERVLRVNLERGGVVYGIIVELLPRGVAIVVDDEDKVLFTTRLLELRDRVVKTGVKYQPPPLKGVSPKAQNLADTLLAYDSLVKGIAKGWGLPGYIAEEIIYRAGLFEGKNAEPAKIARMDLSRLAEEYARLVVEAESGRGYLVYYTEGAGPALFTSFRPRVIAEEYGWSVRELDFDTAVDTFFSFYEKSIARRMVERKLADKKGEVEAAIKGILERVRSFQAELEECKKALNAIYENYEFVEQALLCSQEARRIRGWDSIPRLCDGVKAYQPDKGLIQLRAGDVEFWLDIRLDLKGNIVELRKKMSELEKKIKSALEKKRTLEEELEKIEGSTIEESRIVIRPREWYERYHWLITASGLLAIGGRDAGQNEVIYRKYLEDADIFLHADIHGAPVVVLKTHGREASERDILEAAYLTACYSKAWKAGFASIDVFWARGDQVSKTPPSGEYLSKGSFMVYGRRNYVTIPLELSLGLERVESSVYGVYYRVIVGPEELVRERSVGYVVLRPADKPVENVASEIYDKLVKSRAREFITVGEIIGRIPGPSTIVKIVQKEG
jgi:predicted ribosome quality control (RQC) complex YloA/Tae2 family protein